MTIDRYKREGLGDRRGVQFTIGNYVPARTSQIPWWRWIQMPMYRDRELELERVRRERDHFLKYFPFGDRLVGLFAYRFRDELVRLHWVRDHFHHRLWFR